MTLPLICAFVMSAMLTQRRPRPRPQLRSDAGEARGAAAVRASKDGGRRGARDGGDAASPSHCKCTLCGALVWNIRCRALATSLPIHHPDFAALRPGVLRCCVVPPSISVHVRCVACTSHQHTLRLVQCLNVLRVQVCLLTCCPQLLQNFVYQGASLWDLIRRPEALLKVCCRSVLSICHVQRHITSQPKSRRLLLTSRQSP